MHAIVQEEKKLFFSVKKILHRYCAELMQQYDPYFWEQMERSFFLAKPCGIAENDRLDLFQECTTVLLAHKENFSSETKRVFHSFLAFIGPCDFCDLEGYVKGFCLSGDPSWLDCALQRDFTDADGQKIRALSCYALQEMEGFLSLQKTLLSQEKMKKVHRLLLLQQQMGVLMPKETYAEVFSVSVKKQTKH
jgi:hypothetical protein